MADKQLTCGFGSGFIQLPLRSDAAAASGQDCYDVLREYADYPNPAIGRLVVGPGLQKCETDSPLFADQWPSSDELVGLEFGGCEGHGVDAKTSGQTNPLRYMTSIPAVQAPRYVDHSLPALFLSSFSLPFLFFFFAAVSRLSLARACIRL